MNLLIFLVIFSDALLASKSEIRLDEDSLGFNSFSLDQETISEVTPIEESPLETYERIKIDLKMPTDAPTNASAVDFIMKELTNSHVSKNLFYQNCEKYNSIVLEQVLMSKSFALKEIKNIMPSKCLEKVINQNPFKAITKLISSKSSLEYLVSLCTSNDAILEKVQIQFKESPFNFEEILNERICNNIISENSKSSKSENNKWKWKQLFLCVYKFPLNSEFTDAFIDESQALDLEEFSQTLITRNSPMFLVDSLKSIKNNRPDDLIILLANWKKIIEFVLKEKENDEIVNNIFYYLMPAYSLKSTIYREYKIKNPELVDIFNKFPIEKISSIKSLLLDLLTLFQSKNYHKTIESIFEFQYFMNPDITNFSECKKISFEKTNSLFWNELIDSIIKFNPKNFDKFVQVIHEDSKPGIIRDLFEIYSPKFLDFPLENNTLLYYLTLNDMEKYFGNVESSSINIMKYIDQLKKLVPVYPEANVLATLSLLVSAYPENLTAENKEEINSIIQEWIDKSHYLHVNVFNQLIKSLKKSADFKSLNWILNLKEMTDSTPLNKSELLHQNLHSWLANRSDQLKFVLNPFTNNNSSSSMNNFPDPREGKIVSRDENEIVFYFETPKRLSNKLFLDDEILNSLKEESEFFNGTISSDILLKALITFSSNQKFYFKKPNPVKYKNSAKINGEEELSDQRKNDIIDCMLQFREQIQSNEIHDSYIQFKFLDKEFGKGPDGEHLHAIIKSIFIHNEKFGIVSDSNGNILPALMVSPELMKILGAMIGQLVSYFNIVPEFSFHDIVYEYIHDLSSENFNKFWEKYCEIDQIMKGLKSILDKGEDIGDYILNRSNNELTFTSFEIKEKDKNPHILNLIHSNWNSTTVNEQESLPEFKNNESAKVFLENRINLFKANLFDSLLAFRDGLAVYLDLDLLKGGSKSFSSLFASKLPTREELIEALEIESSDLDRIMLKSSTNDTDKISLRQAFIDFLKEAKESDYRGLLKRWLISPNIFDLNSSSMRPKVDVMIKKEINGDEIVVTGYISEDSIKFLKQSGYALKNSHSSSSSSSVPVKREVYLKTQTCSSLLLLAQYDTVDELRAALLILAHSDETHRAKD